MITRVGDIVLSDNERDAVEAVRLLVSEVAATMLAIELVMPRLTANDLLEIAHNSFARNVTRELAREELRRRGWSGV